MGMGRLQAGPPALHLSRDPVHAHLPAGEPPHCEHVKIRQRKPGGQATSADTHTPPRHPLRGAQPTHPGLGEEGPSSLQNREGCGWGPWAGRNAAPLWENMKCHSSSMKSGFVVLFQKFKKMGWERESSLTALRGALGPREQQLCRGPGTRERGTEAPEARTEKEN